jgi:hypothetical protein
MEDAQKSNPAAQDASREFLKQESFSLAFMMA